MSNKFLEKTYEMACDELIKRVNSIHKPNISGSRSLYIGISKCKKYWNVLYSNNEIGSLMYIANDLNGVWAIDPFWDDVRVYIKDTLLGKSFSLNDFSICSCNAQDLWNFGCPSARGKECNAKKSV